MNINSKFKRLFGNLLYAITAQGISLILSILMSLIVPKLLGVEEFGYWQLFIFYSNYAGFFHFGLNDGIYLRYGGIKYNSINYPLIGSQFWISFIGQAVLALGMYIYVMMSVSDSLRTFVLVATLVYMIIINASGYLGFVFQAANLTKKFSISVMIDKAFFICFVFMLLFARATHFEVFVIMYIFGKFISLAYCAIVGRKILFTGILPLKVTLSQIGQNISIGIKLMLSNIAGMLILGVGRFFIDQRWGISSFGKFSLAISLANFFLLFISQISMVLFPAMRQTNSQNLSRLYYIIRESMGILLSSIYIFYYPANYILSMWLPQYSESIRFMVLLLPLCIFDGKMQTVCNTYLKVLRKERILLFINVMTFLLSIILTIYSTYILKNINFVTISMTISIIFRSIIAEIYLNKNLKISNSHSLIGELILTFIFVIITWYLQLRMAFFIYTSCYIIYLVVNRTKITSIIKLLQKMLLGNANSQ